VKDKKNIIKAVLVAFLCLNITIILQAYVGWKTIYRPEQSESREFLHDAILKNKLPEGKKWSDFGASGTGTRILSVKLAETIRSITGVKLEYVYIMIDSVFLFLCLISLYIFLNQWLEPVYCLIGILYFGICLISSYHFHYFHPWDRMSLFSWIVLAFLIKNKKTALFAVLLVFSILIKYDVKILPILYLFYNYDQKNKVRILTNTFLLLLLSFGTHKLLQSIYPAYSSKAPSISTDLSLLPNFYPHYYIQKIALNLKYLLKYNLAHPFFAVFILPLTLSVMYFKKKERFAKCSVIFASLLFIPHLLIVNFREFRAQTMILMLILPAALLSLKYIAEGGGEESEP
jgi:hypothetical protein